MLSQSERSISGRPRLWQSSRPAKSGIVDPRSPWTILSRDASKHVAGRRSLTRPSPQEDP
jgi:hypothetical protein